ncbi:hypothetical protein [Permianibacter aggregans]|uniref:Uncharacterized protein n=1 Tax=Permianibacter aggregans TaxID=1510150 RepID=A0A4R6UVP1_9GAMM|nr:hypothetical protein [Permianibacter aggregans]QGX40349.1 hypothetical protein E2H98_11965 [Permianibacter aggregans]TDQ49525.1 hypothetical protein EV696_104231 [Permianibacter aggregans]
MRLLLLLATLSLQSCHDDRDDLNVPIKLDDDETRVKSLSDFREKRIAYRETTDGLIYIRQSDAEFALAILQKNHENYLPENRSISVPTERYEQIKKFIHAKKIVFLEKRSSDKIFFVFETEVGREAVDQYLDEVVEQELLKTYNLNPKSTMEN